MSKPERDAKEAAFKSRLIASLEPLGLHPIERLPRPAIRAISVRRGPVHPPTDALEVLSLTRDAAGILRWQTGPGPSRLASASRRARPAGLPPGRVVQQFAYERIAPNEALRPLNRLDDRLTPNRGLRRWDNSSGKLVRFPNSTQTRGKRVLLLIHGTFSNCDHLIEEILKVPAQGGQAFLARASQSYDRVLAFDHPTVGVSPVMNAFDLAGLLRPMPRELHIICHSRGGLVARWFLEGFATDELRRTARAVMVAASIAGTSLAAPARLKSALDYLANLGEVLGNLLKLGSVHPFLTAAAVITQVVASVTRLAANTPLLDAAIALIPGLHGQSKVGNNPELTRLRAGAGRSIAQSGIQYFAVRADFQPKDPGWNFLQYFSRPMQRLANRGADLIFDGPNDLVVDCSSMVDLADGVKIAKVHEYGVTDVVHHSNYFQQEPTLKFIAKGLGF
jgi:hypothetical protein